MGGKSKAPAPPDYGPIAEASKEAAEIAAGVSREQLAWAKQQYALDREVIDMVVSRALATQDQNTEAAIKDRQRYEQVFQGIEDQLVRESDQLANQRDWRQQAYAPLEDAMLQDSLSYSTPERMDMEVGRAKADVAGQAEAARRNATQQLESFGINPASTRFAALDRTLQVQSAAAQTSAGNQARDRVEGTSRALQDRALGYKDRQDAIGRAVSSEAINIGRGMPGQAIAAYGTALQAGNQAANTMLAGTASGANTMGTGLQWQGAQNNALAGWGNALNMGYQNQLSTWQANQQASSGIGSALGLIGGIVAPMLADGGEVPETASPTGGDTVDDVHAKLTAGEFVIPRDVVEWMGERNMHQLIEKAKKEMGEMPQRSGAIPTMGVTEPAAPTFDSAIPQR